MITFGKAFDPEWRQKADRYMESVVRFLKERKDRSKISKEEYILEKALTFLLNDLREALENDQPEEYLRLIEEIDKYWVELYKQRHRRV